MEVKFLSYRSYIETHFNRINNLSQRQQLTKGTKPPPAFLPLLNLSTLPLTLFKPETNT